MVFGVQLERLNTEYSVSILIRAFENGDVAGYQLSRKQADPLPGLLRARHSRGPCAVRCSTQHLSLPFCLRFMGFRWCQSVRLLNYEVSEMQRWEASFSEQSPHTSATGAASPTPNAGSDAPQPEERDSTLSAVNPGDGNASSPPQLCSPPRPDAAAPR